MDSYFSSSTPFRHLHVYFATKMWNGASLPILMCCAHWQYRQPYSQTHGVVVALSELLRQLVASVSASSLVIVRRPASLLSRWWRPDSRSSKSSSATPPPLLVQLILRVLLLTTTTIIMMMMSMTVLIIVMMMMMVENAGSAATALSVGIAGFIRAVHFKLWANIGPRDSCLISIVIHICITMAIY